MAGQSKIGRSSQIVFVTLFIAVRSFLLGYAMLLTSLHTLQKKYSAKPTLPSPNYLHVLTFLHLFLFCKTTSWAQVKLLWVIHIHHSQKFWSIFGGRGQGELSTFHESLARRSLLPRPPTPPLPLPHRALSGACFAYLLANDSAMQELANEHSH